MKLSQLRIFTRAPFQGYKGRHHCWGEKVLQCAQVVDSSRGAAFISCDLSWGVLFPDVADRVSPAPIVIPYSPGTTHWFTKIDLDRIEVGKCRTN